VATGRIGVTPTLRTRWSEQPTAGTTVLSGLDDNSVALVYDAGYEAVYRNGVLLSRGNDYTATNGTTITLIDATLAGDIIEVFANDLVPLTDAISKAQYTAKGALLSASAASTPGVVTVGANGTVLTADSAESTGLKWAAVATSPASANNTVGTQQSTTSGTYVGLTTAQSVTLTTGTKVLVLISANFQNDTSNGGAFMSYAISGATTLAAADSFGVGITYGGSVTDNTTLATRHSFQTVTAGSNTFTAQFRRTAGTGTSFFSARSITVIDLGS
jgi:hypothetical protein